MKPHTKLLLGLLPLAAGAPAPVIQGWGEHEAVAKLDGAAAPRGAIFRYGYRHRLDGTDLIVWVKAEAEQPVRLALSAVN